MTLNKVSNPKSEKKNRREKISILRHIKDFIEHDEELLVFNKSALLIEPWNLDPRTVEEFMEIIYFCQDKIPRIQIIKRNGKKFYQILDYKRLFQEMKEQKNKLVQIDESLKIIDQFNPKVYPVFKCKTCGFELGYPAHHNEPLKFRKSERNLICVSNNCNFTQKIPEHHQKRMEIYIKYTQAPTEIEED